jgi:hypothetical protein
LPAPHSVYVSLPASAAEALRELSRREFRHPRDQAQKLLVEGLRAAGALPAESPSVSVEAPATVGGHSNAPALGSLATEQGRGA